MRAHTRTHPAVPQKFKRRLLKYYYGLDKPDEGTIACMLLGAALPSAVVVASHLFKSVWAKHGHLLGLDKEDHGIESPRNGLLLAKPIEWLFDEAVVSFLPHEDALALHLWRSDYATKTIGDVVADIPASEWENKDEWPQGDWNALTIGSLVGRPLRFRDPGRMPFRRCLCFQARRAEKGADTPASFDDFWSDCDARDTVRQFLAGALCRSSALASVPRIPLALCRFAAGAWRCRQSACCACHHSIGRYVFLSTCMRCTPTCISRLSR